MDIAGIVRGASEGEGLGNKFLVPHPGVGGDLPGDARLPRRGRHPRRRRGQPGQRHLHDPDRADPGRPADTGEGDPAAGEGGQGQQVVGGLRRCCEAGAGRPRCRDADHRNLDRPHTDPRAVVADREAVHLRLQLRLRRARRRGPQGEDARARRAIRGDLPRRQVRGRAGRARRRRRGPRDAGRDGRRRARPRGARPRRLRHPRPADLPHRRPQGGPRVDDPQGRHRARGGRCHPHRLPARVHQGRGDLLRRARRRRLHAQGRSSARSASRARTTSCRTATWSSSGSTCKPASEHVYRLSVLAESSRSSGELPRTSLASHVAARLVRSSRWAKWPVRTLSGVMSIRRFGAGFIPKIGDSPARHPCLWFTSHDRTWGPGTGSRLGGVAPHQFRSDPGGIMDMRTFRVPALSPRPPLSSAPSAARPRKPGRLPRPRVWLPQSPRTGTAATTSPPPGTSCPMPRRTAWR